MWSLGKYLCPKDKEFVYNHCFFNAKKKSFKSYTFKLCGFESYVVRKSTQVYKEMCNPWNLSHHKVNMFSVLTNLTILRSSLSQVSFTVFRTLSCSFRLDVKGWNPLMLTSLSERIAMETTELYTDWTKAKWLSIKHISFVSLCSLTSISIIQNWCKQKKERVICKQ